MIHLLASGGFTFDQFFHPLRYWGYEFWSGLGSDLGEVTLIAAVIASATTAYRTYRKRTECHVTGCTNHGLPVQGTGYRACHVHHPGLAHSHGEDITPEHIARAHEIARRSCAT